MSRLTARAIPYSSVVGGGLILVDEKGAARFGVIFRGTSWGISKEQNNQLSEQIINLINTNGIEVDT